MNRPDQKNKTLKTVITALIFCGFFVMAGFLAIPEAHAESDYIYSGSLDETVRKIDSSGNEIWSFDGHSDSVYGGLAVDSDGYVYSGSMDETLKKIDPLGNEVWTFDGHFDTPYGIAIDSDGYVYSGSWDDTLRKIDPSGNQVWRFDGHSGSVYGVALDSDGYIYSGSMDETVKKIDPSGNEVWTFNGHSDRVYGVAVDSDGYVYSGSHDETVRKIDPSGHQVWRFDGHSDRIHDIAIDSDGYVYSISWDGKVKRIDPSGNEVWTFDGHTGQGNGVAVDSDGYVYSASSDDTVRKIDPSGNEVWSFDGHTASVRAVAVDPYDVASEPEPFDGFEAITKPADPYSLNEYVLTSEVLDFGDYDFEASDNHLAQGVQVIDGDGQIIHQPAMNIINNFETPADFSTVFEAEPGETYGYRWRYYYINYITGQTIDSKLTPLEVFTHEVDEEAPELETLNAQDVTETGAELHGRVLSLGDYESLEVSFEWVEAGGENWNETDPVATLDDTFEYPATVWDILDNLEPATTYYFRIKADEYRGSAVSFTTGEEPIDDPDDPVPVDWDDWPSFYDLESDEEFDDPVGVIDGIGTTFDGIMGSIIERIEPFEERLETGQAYSHGREAGEFIPTMRGYLIEFRPFFGGLPVAEVFVFFLIFQVVILGIKGVMIALGFLPFF